MLFGIRGKDGFYFVWKETSSPLFSRQAPPRKGDALPLKQVKQVKLPQKDERSFPIELLAIFQYQQGFPKPCRK